MDLMMEGAELKQRIEQALAEVVDPETGLSITRMDLIHDLEVTEQGEVTMVFRPSSPVCPMAYTLANSIKQKVQEIGSINSVRIRVENFNRAEHLESLLNASI